MWTKTVNFNCISFKPKFKILKDFSNTVFISGSFCKTKQYLGERAQAIPKRGHFIDAESKQKTLKIFNFTTTYAILMKITADIYLNKVF